jgi:hypothetical protein
MQSAHRAAETNWLNAALACAVLVVGSLVYLLDRPADTALFPGAILSNQKLPGLFGPIGNSLPTFAHAFSFSILTAVWLGGARRACLAACLAWFAIDCAFEVGQHALVAERLVKLIPNWFEHLPILAQANSYFLMGTFDVWDLTSIGIGAATAYLVTAQVTFGDIHNG